jgi:hypothetical protein
VDRLKRRSVRRSIQVVTDIADTGFVHPMDNCRSTHCARRKNELSVLLRDLSQVERNVVEKRTSIGLDRPIGERVSPSPDSLVGLISRPIVVCLKGEKARLQYSEVQRSTTDYKRSPVEYNRSTAEYDEVQWSKWSTGVALFPP